MKYEYKVVRAEFGTMERVLNEYGFQEWECLAVTGVPSNGETRYVCTLKRPLVEPVKIKVPAGRDKTVDSVHRERAVA